MVFVMNYRVSSIRHRESVPFICFFVKLNFVMETSKKYYRVDRRQIAYLRFIFEAYNGIAILQTLDAQKGVVVLHVAPGCEADVEFVLDDLRRDILIEPVSS